MNMVVRTPGDPSALAREVESTAWNLAGDVNVYGTEVLSERIARFEWSSDVSALLLGAFAVLALISVDETQGDGYEFLLIMTETRIAGTSAQVLRFDL